MNNQLYHSTMKFVFKVIVIITLITMNINPVNSQVLIGISDGFSITNFRTYDYNYSLKFNSKNSNSISAFIKTKATKHFWFGFESSYKPLKIDFITDYHSLGGDMHTVLSCNLGYLYNSLISEFRFGDKNCFYFSLNPYYGIKLFGQGNGNSSTYTFSQNYSRDTIRNSGSLFHNESGVTVKCGFDAITVKNFRILAEIGYSLGMSSIYINSSNNIKSSGSFARVGIIYQIGNSSYNDHKNVITKTEKEEKDSISNKSHRLSLKFGYVLPINQYLKLFRGFSASLEKPLSNKKSLQLYFLFYPDLAIDKIFGIIPEYRFYFNSQVKNSRFFSGVYSKYYTNSILVYIGSFIGYQKCFFKKFELDILARFGKEILYSLMESNSDILQFDANLELRLGYKF